MRAYTGIVHNITPRVVDGLLAGTVVEITKVVHMMSVLGFAWVLTTIQKQKLVPWTTQPGMTP